MTVKFRAASRLRNAVIAGLALCSPLTASAANYYWDGNDAAAGFGTASGTWAAPTAGTATSGWSTDPTGATVVDGNSVTTNTGDALNFGHFAAGLALGPIAVSGTVDAGSLTFASGSGAITLSGGTAINLASAATITTNNATDTIGTALTGAATSLTKAGTGTLILSAANTYTGSTLVNAGTLTLNGAAGSISESTAITLSGGGITLTNTNAADAGVDRLGNSAAITSNGGTLTFTNTSGANVYAETIGSVALTRGQLNLVETTNQASTGSQTLTLSGLTRAGTDNTSAITFSAATTGPNATKNMIMVTGATATAANEIIGPWATVGTTAALQTDYAIYNGSQQVVAANIAAAAEANWIDSTKAYTSNVAAVALSGDRTMNALRNTAATATITLSDGASGFKLATNGVLNGVTTLLTLAPGAVAGSVTAPGTTGGSIAMNTGSGAITVSAPINDNGGAVTLIKNGSAGSLTLSSTTSNFSGGTVLNAGAIIVTSDAHLGAGGGVTFAGSATLNMNTSTPVSFNRTFTIHDAAVATFASGNGGKTLATVTGGGALVFSSTTDLILTNASGFTGPITTATGGNTGYGFGVGSLGDSAGAGLVSLGGGGTFRWLGWSAVTFANRQFALSGTTSGGVISALGATAAATLAIQKDLLVTGVGNKTLTLAGSNTGTNTFAGNITNGVGSVISVSKTDGGTWALGGTNTYSGPTNLLASGTTGRLIFQGAQSLSPNTSVVFAQNSSNVQSVRLLDDGAGTINMARPFSFSGTNATQQWNIFVGNNNTANGGSSAGTITSSTIEIGTVAIGSIASDTASTSFNSTGANGYRLKTGAFTLSNANGRAAGSNYVTFFNPTTASLTVASVTMASGNALKGVPILQLAGTATGNAIPGIIEDAADAYTGGRPLSLTKANTSDWTLSGANTYTGNTTVSAGTLLVNTVVNGSDSGTGTGSVSVAAAILGGIGQIAPGSANAVTVNNNGILAPGDGGIGTLTINSANTAASSVLSFTGTGRLQMELGAGLQSDLVDITSATAGDVAFSNTVVNFSDLTAGNLATGAYKLFRVDTAGAYTGLTVNPDFTIASGLTIGTGLSAYIGSTLSLSGDDIVLNVEAVPEPGSLALAALAGLGLLARRRRDRAVK